MMKQKRRIFLFLFFLFSFTQLAFAENAATNGDIQDFATMLSEKYGVDPSYAYGTLAQAEYIPEIIEKITKPAEKMNWYRYREIIFTPERIQKGINFMDKNKRILDWEYREYGVPQSLIVAFLGVETKYGEVLGRYRVLDALATLAFRYPPRSKFFKKELASFILLAYTQQKNPTDFYGSYAGAMGMCQFMPSTYLYYAVAFQNQQYPDLYTNKPDIVFSVGNFLRQHGWDPEKPITAPAIVQGKRYQQILQPNTSLKPKYSLAQLKQYGITPATIVEGTHLKANLISLDAKTGPEFWLGFRNYFVIKHYNNSHLYAMSVYQLSQAIQKGYDELLAKRQADKQQKAEEKVQKETPRNTLDITKK
jgi:membrane-bound lytic murein transglycosylase B